MSKHAIEAYGEHGRLSLARFGVRVSLIEPGNYGSEDQAQHAGPNGYVGRQGLAVRVAEMRQSDQFGCDGSRTILRRTM